MLDVVDENIDIRASSGVMEHTQEVRHEGRHAQDLVIGRRHLDDFLLL